MKKVLSVFLAALVVFGLFAVIPFSAGAANEYGTVIESHISGDYEYAVCDNGTTHITKYNGTASSLTIPSKLGGHTITDIDSFSFIDCTSLKSVTIPDSVINIRVGAFPKCTSLTEVVLGKRVKNIYDSAFAQCTSLKRINIPNSVSIIFNYAFSNCTSLTDITIPNSVSHIGYGTFNDCKSLREIVLPEKLTMLSMIVFQRCTSLKSVYIPAGVANIYESAFSGCTALKDIYFAGSKAQWNKIKIDSGNEILKNVTIHFNSIRPGTLLTTPKITKTENTASGVKLTIGKVTGAAKYRIFIKKSGKWTKLADTASVIYTHTGAKSGTKYTYTVRCLAGDGKSYSSAYNTAGWTATFIAQPSLPVLKNTKNGVQITLRKVTGAAKYRIFRKKGSGKWAKLADTAKLSYVDKAAKNGVTYSYTIRCITGSGKTYTSSYNANGRTIKCVR